MIPIFNIPQRRFFHLLIGLFLAVSPTLHSLPNDTEVLEFLDSYCIRCHGGEKVKGDTDFSLIKSEKDFASHFELWETVADVLAYEEMPPEEEEKRPTNEEAQGIIDWYEERFIHTVEARPAEFKPRRLSAPEYRNTLTSLFGFELENTVMAAEQTRTESSLAMKLLPVDPPGKSGFVNDTHGVRLDANTWEQYVYLAERALSELFSPKRRDALEALLGQPLPPNFETKDLTQEQARSLLKHFSLQTSRRPLERKNIDKIFSSIKGLKGEALVSATQDEIKTLLVSSAFLYRGLLMEGISAQQQPVDSYELAERLSYFLWEDMPDEALLLAAKRNQLSTPSELEAQVNRMLASSKSISLAESFGAQWLGLADIDNADNDVTKRDALRSQPIDFLNYLFTENRPVIELIDSKVAFANYITAGYYPKTKSQLVKYQKPKGIERQLVPNQRMMLQQDDGRGGILTMPGILAMNRGPILRGTWMLRRILGERLGEPPADVPAIRAKLPAEDLTFRERFEQHRSDPTCARCHDRLDPLGFSMQIYDDAGFYKLVDNYKPPRRKKEHDDMLDVLDSSGRFPSGESFEDYEGLKQILLNSKRKDIIRNAVEQTLSYALCRKLEAFDRPTIDAITEKIDENNGSWRDLFVEVTLSLPFNETILP
ncbi:MAG: DUF1592 domain-containing protein [Opitutales bacterium]|nr:DUF1592 domain-containing protein [Opitutales bacterium]